MLPSRKILDRYNSNRNYVVHEIKSMLLNEKSDSTSTRFRPFALDFVLSIT
jgi:hypothetical protein